MRSSERVASDDLCRALAGAAAAEDAGTRPIKQSVALLESAGLLTDDGLIAPEQTARALMKVGAANLSVGRLLEGHINAMGLIALYGTRYQRAAVYEKVARGGLLGVWGADAEVPVTCAPTDNRLSGAKTYASGLGTVTDAIVTVNSGPDVRLALVDVHDMDRADPAEWQMQGMKATASGRYDFTGMPTGSFDWIGQPGDYLKEPHFVGGVWRIAALQVGAAVGLLDRAAETLRAADRLSAEAQKSRLMSALMAAWSGMALVERAALAAGGSNDEPERLVSVSIAARLITEEIGLDAIRAVEQSLGLRHFAAHSDTGRIARDLSVYLRQAARDAFLQRAADEAFAGDGAIWGIFR